MLPEALHFKKFELCSVSRRILKHSSAEQTSFRHNKNKLVTEQKQYAFSPISGRAVYKAILGS